jgi:hypothetical protein
VALDGRDHPLLGLLPGRLLRLGVLALETRRKLVLNALDVHNGAGELLHVLVADRRGRRGIRWRRLRSGRLLRDGRRDGQGGRHSSRDENIPHDNLRFA